MRRQTEAKRRMASSAALRSAKIILTPHGSSIKQMAPEAGAIIPIKLLAVVPDAIERSDEIVRDQQRTIGQLRHIDGATQIIAIVVPSFGKRLGFSCGVTIVLEVRHHYPSADWHGPIPRTVLRREDRALILLRKHAAGVEHQTEVCRMSGLLNLRENHIGGGGVVLVFNGACTTAAIPGKAEILTGIGDAVHFARGLLVAHAIDLIVVGPERLVLGVEVHADRVAQSNRIDLTVLAVTVHADDPAHANLAVKIKLLFRWHVVGLT